MKKIFTNYLNSIDLFKVRYTNICFARLVETNEDQFKNLVKINIMVIYYTYIRIENVI